MRFIIILLAGLLAQNLNAQQASPYIKFGKITADELQKKIYSIDSNANAVVLSDIGNAAIEGNSKGWFSVAYSFHKVIHILNKAGYDEANVDIQLYKDGDAEEKLEDVRAVTYNLESGKIIETKLEKSGIFKEKKDRNRVQYKFTMPNVKEGSIIEYEYKITSDFIWNLHPWVFQGESPELWSEFGFSVPSFFTYGFIGHGYQPFYINEHKDRQERFVVRETRTAGASEGIDFNEGVTDYRWVMKDVPELKQESFTSSLINHLARIEFQLSSKNYPLTPEDYRNNWFSLTKELLGSSDFGSNLSTNNGWMSDDIKAAIKGASSEVEKARNIYTYVRDNFTCTDDRALWMQQSLKNVLKSKKGSVSEINILLTAMLRYAGLSADPVILSTRENGYALALYPMLTNFNYVVAKFTTGDKEYYLDASHPRLGFGKMLPECYNGHAREVSELANAVNLSTDSIKERKVTAFFITNDEKGKWAGNVNQTLGYFDSYKTRNKIKEKGQDEFFKDIKKEFGFDISIQEPHIDSLTNLEEPVALRYGIELNPEKEDILYINPMFTEGYRKNPFTAAERTYPVEMPYKSDETYLLTLEVPNGYMVDELPKQLVAKLDEQGSAFFEYLISQSGTTISLRSRIKFERTFFMPEEYETLREFFKMIVGKQNEQIVFKKKK